MLFEVKNPKTGEKRYADPDDYLNIPQKLKLPRNPDMILQYAHYIRNLVISNAGFTPELLASIKIGINGREYKDLVKPNLNLSELKTFEASYKWVEPFKNKTKKKE